MGVEGVNIYSTYCKNFCKCLNVPPHPEQQSKKKKQKIWEIHNYVNITK
jgi:hypothetical protein